MERAKRLLKRGDAHPDCDTYTCWRHSHAGELLVTNQDLVLDISSLPCSRRLLLCLHRHNPGLSLLVSSPWPVVLAHGPYSRHIPWRERHFPRHREYLALRLSVFAPITQETSIVTAAKVMFFAGAPTPATRLSPRSPSWSSVVSKVPSQLPGFPGTAAFRFKEPSRSQSRELLSPSSTP